MNQVVEYATRAALLGSMGALIPLADAPLAAEIAGPILASVGHWLYYFNKARYIPYVERDDDLLKVKIRRRYGAGQWPKAAQKIDPGVKTIHRYDGTTIPDHMEVGKVSVSHVDADEKMVGLVVQAKQLAREYHQSGPSEIVTLEQRANRLLKNKEPLRKRVQKRLTA